MAATARRLIASWLAGSLVGTAIIAVTSPLFVRSYVPLEADPIRGVWTLPAGETYRWRSEGYADTWIGPMGMPGRREIPAREPDVLRVALWGDSQAEGVCVGDAFKLPTQMEGVSGGRLCVFPLARSGEDAADWLTQMPAVEGELGLDAHVILVVDVEDLRTATDAPLPPPDQTDVAAANASIAATFPAFVIQAARHLLRGADETTPRRLRFGLGPVESVVPFVDAAAPGQAMDERAAFWRQQLEAIRSASKLPILILFAPVAPQIIDGNIVVEIPAQREWDFVAGIARQYDIRVARADTQLSDSANAGRWPHGFHNGQIGSGHLNRYGNAAVASVLVEQILDRDPRTGSSAAFPVAPRSTGTSAVAPVGVRGAGLERGN